MAGKLYSKTTWVDEVLAGVAAYLLKDDAGDTVYEEASISLATGVITAGTAVTAATMQNIEDGVDDLDDLLVSLQSKFALDAATEITVSSGTLTLSQSVHKVQPESGTADDIDNLAGLSAGQFGVLFPSDNGTDTLTLKHGTGNISCIGGSDVALSEGAVIVYYDGTTYFIIGTSAGGGGSAPATTAENDFQVGNGAGAWIKKTLAETKTILAVLESLVGDTTPQLGGDLDMNDHGISVNVEPTDDLDYQGIVATMTVDTNAEGVGAPLFLAADGHLDTADADTVATAPCVALALETGTGSKKVLLMGTLRVDAWNWTIGPGATSLIYLSETVGTLTQTKPTTEDAVVQPVGFALTDDMIMFNPSMIFVTHGA